MKKAILLSLILLSAIVSQAQSLKYARSTTIQVESLKPGVNRIKHEGMRFNVTYRDKKIVKAQRLLPGGKKRNYELKANNPGQRCYHMDLLGR